jgi:hypothetical protein
VLALLLSAALAPAAWATPETPLPVHVTFTGAGQFSTRNTEGNSISALDTLDWTVEYQATLNPDGTLGVAEGPPVLSPGHYEFTDAFFDVNCGDALPTQPPPASPGDPNPPPAMVPVPRARGSEIESITYLSDDQNNVDYSQCVGKGMLPFDGQGEASNAAAGLLDHFLPGALTARITPVPRQLLLASGVAIHIEHPSSRSAPVQVPESCSDLYGIDDPSKCSMSLSWSGMVILDATAGCPVILAAPSRCLPPSGTSLPAFTQGVDVHASGPGSASVSATAPDATSAASAIESRKARDVVVATGHLKIKHAGLARLRPHLTSAGRRALQHARRLKVRIQITFAPRSGPRHVTRFVTFLRRH